MQDLKREFVSVIIDSPVKCHVSVDGRNEFADIDIVHLKCFNVKDHKNLTLPLRNKYKRMMLGNAALFEKLIGNVKKDDVENKVEESEEERVEGILQILSISDSDEVLSFYEKFKAFLSSGIAFKDAELKSPMNGSEVEKLDNDDLEKIIANYIVVFFSESWKM